MTSLKKKLLLVDDDPEVAWGLGRRLTREGFTVTVCGDGAEAVPLLERRPFDVLVTDIQMPRMNGLELIKWTANHKPDICIVAITAFGSPSVQKVALKKGAILYLEKPVDPEILIDMIHSYEEPDSFSGSIEGIDIFDYVQLLLMTKQQLVLEITSKRGNRGVLYIDLGRVRHAECGDLRGEEAFFECLSFEGGSFSSLPWRPPPETTIELPGDFLLMEAARIKDERAAGGDAHKKDDKPSTIEGDDDVAGFDGMGNFDIGDIFNEEEPSD